METKTQTYRRSWRSQGQILALGLGLILFMDMKFRMTAHGHLTFWAYVQATVVFLLVFAEMGFWLHRPTLSLDPDGVRLDALQYSWTYRWKDIQQVDEFEPHTPPLMTCLGLRLRAGVEPQHRLAEALWRTVYGYSAVIGDGWDAPLPQLRESIERYRTGASA
ncbi:MAG: hypothetical protein WA840_23075 [Caulobacteraceae bacterium]